MNRQTTRITPEETIGLLEKAQEIARIGSWVAELDDSDRLEWSPETYRIFGIDQTQFGGTSTAFFAFVHPDDVDAVRRASNAARGGECAYEIEHRILRGDGAVRWVQEKADVVRGADGHPVRMVGTVQDVTDKRQLEEHLRQSQKLEAIGQLAGGIAHDLNNSLTAIIGFTELALSAIATGDPARLDVQEIRRAAARAASVTRQLLAFSRKQMLEPRVFSLAESASNIGRMIERVIGPSITLTTVAPETVPPIYGDPGQIEQAILNIAVNARDAMPDGGALSMSVSAVQADEAFSQQNQPMPLGRYAELRISDTGFGMDAATKARAFEPFFTTKEVGKGTGLGLAMVYGTVRQSGGYIFLDSEPGKGATFRLYFPSAEGRPEHPVRRVANVTTGTVLVVDDEPAIRRLTTTALRRKGHRVLQAASGEEALGLAAAETGPIDVLLTDASMPGMGGIELARTLAAERPDMLIVIMSGFTEKSLALHDAGVPAMLLPKPFSPTELQRTIARVLSGRSTGRS